MNGILEWILEIVCDEKYNTEIMFQLLKKKKITILFYILTGESIYAIKHMFVLYVKKQQQQQKGTVPS